MVLFWSLLLWFSFCALTWKRWFFVRVTTLSNGHEQVSPTFFSLFMCFAPLLVIASARTSFADTAAYISTFESLEASVSNMLTYQSKDAWFYRFAVLIKLIVPDANVWLFIIALVQVILLCYVIRRYSVMPSVSLFLFIASTEFTYMMNGMRQFLAVCMCFAGLRLLEKRRFVLFTLLVLLAAQFHGSAYFALLLLAAYFVKPWGKITYFMLAIVVAMLVYLEPILNSTSFIFDATDYESTIAELLDLQGVNIIRVFVALVPCVIGFVFRHNDALKDNRIYRICINCALLNLMFFTAASITGGNLMARIAEYFTIFQLLTYPFLFKYCFRGNLRYAVVGIFSACYVAWFWYEMSVHWNVRYISTRLGWYF